MIKKFLAWRKRRKLDRLLISLVVECINVYISLDAMTSILKAVVREDEKGLKVEVKYTIWFGKELTYEMCQIIPFNKKVTNDFLNGEKMRDVTDDVIKSLKCVLN